MGMGIGINVQKPDAGAVRGRQEDIACGVWFTSQGHTMPKLVKFQDKDGGLHTIDNIHVVCSSRKNFCGVPAIEYECTTIKEDMKYSFKLIFYVEQCRWKMVLG